MFNDIGCGDNACGCMNTESNTSITDVVNDNPVCKKHDRVMNKIIISGLVEFECVDCEDDYADEREG